jgi:hypothetical protein
MKGKNVNKRLRMSGKAKERKRNNTEEGIRLIHSFALQSVSLLPDGSYGISISAFETKIDDRIKATITFEATK